MSVKGRQIKIKPDTQPNCVIAMIRKVLSGIRMRKHDQTVAVKRQPRQLSVVRVFGSRSGLD
jgi:hypothetical protein